MSVPPSVGGPAPDAGGRRRRAVVLAAALAGFAAACALGAWQLDRAAQKGRLQAQLDARSRMPALDAASLARSAGAAAGQHFRPVVLSGRWLAAQTVFLDNRQMEGKVGFFVVTPLQLESTGGAAETVLVQRGWAPRRFDDRAALPAIATPAGTVRVAGRVAPPPGRLFEFAGAASGPIQQNLDLDVFARATGLSLLPLSVVELDRPGAPADGLLRRWAAPAADTGKHHGYAFQWFGLAALIAFLYVWHQIVRPRRQRT